MKKFTKIITLMLTLIITLVPFTTTISAKNIEITNIKKEDGTNIQEISWFYKDVKFTVITDHKLTKDEKREFESSFDENNKKNEEINISYIPNDGGGIVVGGPANRTFDNTIEIEVVRYAVDLVGAYVAIQVGTVAWGPIAVATTDYFTNKMLEAIPEYTYWGFWQTKTYSDYYGYYMFYNTDVRYQNSDYTNAIEVYYYNTNYHE